MLKVKVTLSEITYPSCQKFFSVFPFFVAPWPLSPVNFFWLLSKGHECISYQCFLLAAAPGQTITTASCETLGRLPNLSQPQSPPL